MSRQPDSYRVSAIVAYRKAIVAALASAPLNRSAILDLVSTPGCSGDMADLEKAMGTLLEMQTIRFSRRDGVFRLVKPAAMELTEFYVKSERATRIASGGTCDRCHLYADVLWRYADTSLGNARAVCSECKPEVQDTSWGSKDVMDTPMHKTSHFEADRRKH